MNNLRNIPAPAKLNLFLHVVGQRDDGYHLLETFFDLIDWNDTLSFDLRGDGALVLATPLPGVPPQIDLCVQAAAQLAQYARSRERDVPGVTISVDKHLPIGGGIGGGSSDAATTLLALNRLWNLNFPRATLAKIGLTLGADVPIFIQGLPSWASGIGEKLEPTKLWPGLFYVVLVPDTQVPTSAIFSAPELTRDTKPLRIEGSLFEDSLLLENMQSEKSRNGIKKAIKNQNESDNKSTGKLEAEALGVTTKLPKFTNVANGNADNGNVANGKIANGNAPHTMGGVSGFGSSGLMLNSAQVMKFSALKNDLQAVAVTRFPKVAGALAALKSASAGHHSTNMVVPPRMTGSGACVFAGFSSEETAQAVAEKVALVAEANTFIKVARSLKQHPLREWSFSA
jgi:4-diphosphocytidyl-2C-methyl-D-erythritol kinase